MSTLPPPPPPPVVAPGRVGWGWLGLAVVALLSFVVQVPFSIVLLVTGPRGLRLEAALAGIVFWWWVWRGAWLRTRWGRSQAEEEPPWAERGLSPSRSWGYTWIAALCAAALAIALGTQAAIGHWA